METFDNAKVGDRVWNIRHGWGEIVKIEKYNKYIYVKFKAGFMIDFTFEGKYVSTDVSPSLFWNEFEAPEEAYEKPLPSYDKEEEDENI